MPKAKKLPSGSYRCQVFAGYEMVDGKKKRKYESFTAPTKREAEAAAARWAATKKPRPDNLSVLESVKKYISAREPVLSPSTVRGYNACLDRFEMIADKSIRKLTDADVQIWVSDLSTRLSPKTVKNTYGLFTAAVQFVSPDTSFNVHLPSKLKKDYYLPSDHDIKKLLDYANGPLWIAIMLARYYSLREGEICALRSDDLQGNVLTVRRAMIHTKDNEWILVGRPKTDDSYRYLIVSDPLLSVLKQIDGYFIDCNPNALANRFRRALAACKIKPFNFHTLRHMFASSAAMMGIPDFYTAKMGGWSQNSTVLKSVYQNVRDEDFRAQMDRMNKSMQHDLQHETPKNKKRAAK